MWWCWWWWWWSNNFYDDHLSVASTVTIASDISPSSTWPAYSSFWQTSHHHHLDHHHHHDHQSWVLTWPHSGMYSLTSFTVTWTSRLKIWKHKYLSKHENVNMKTSVNHNLKHQHVFKHRDFSEDHLSWKQRGTRWVFIFWVKLFPKTLFVLWWLRVAKSDLNSTDAYFATKKLAPKNGPKMT